MPDPEEKVWFLPEEDASPFYIVYEASPRALRQLLGECYFFEYYLIDQDHEWLLCENHHRMVFAVGREARERLTRFRPRPAYFPASAKPAAADAVSACAAQSASGRCLPRK